MIINGLDNIYYFVKDVEESLKFYSGVLGLEVLDKSEHWASLSLNRVRLGLHKAGASEFLQSAQKRAGATVTLSVNDIEHAYETLKLRGVKFLDAISHNPWGSHVSFQDPDGNLLDLRQAPKGLNLSLGEA